ncbi:MAG: methionine--tRNA ligase [Candidatus Adiutrix sp.]|jgi:methionyl-tRNA synthetase|nr:methionine--tRNA ligase [Candidatus Adiutrix sp.]
MRFYATTPIYYVNAKPHLGHAYTTIITDAVTRFHQLCGEDARFITGTDEHGDKIVQAAEQNGQSPAQYAGVISGLFRATWPKLEIRNSDFIRTTEERHKKAVAKFLDRVKQKGDLYYGDYGGYYCFGCERFYTEKELEDGFCPQHRTRPRYISEENYFFRMSNYQDWLIDHIRKNPDFIRPERYRNEVLGLMRDPLDDLCISRPKSRLTWGIDLPFDDKFVTYVWFDALISYISVLGWPDGELFGRYWPAAQHFIAKDILKPHAIFWPTMLQSAGLPLYQHLNVHGYWQMGQAKMGKSVGNVVDALNLADTYGVDAFRYFLARDMVFGLDSEFVEDGLVGRYNADLANDLGNLWQRSLTMLGKFGGGVIPEGGTPPADQDQWNAYVTDEIIGSYQGHFRNMTPHLGLVKAWELISRLNKYIDSQAPWALARDPGKKPHLQGVLRRLIVGLGVVGALIWPVMPKTGEEIWRRLGLKPEDMSLDLGRIYELLDAPGRRLAPGEPLFPRVEFGGEKAATKAESARDQSAGTETAKGEAVPKKAAKSDIPPAESISFEEFKRLDLRVAEVVAAERVPKSDKLLKLTIKVGDSERIIVAGMGKHYTPEEITGRSVIIVANLAPAKLMGITSEGMVLAAARREGDGEILSLLTTAAPMPSGIRVS